MLKQLTFLAGAIAFFLCLPSRAQEKAALKLVDWKPVSQLVVPQTEVIRPKFPVIDIHNHLGNLDKAGQYLAEMDKTGVVMAVSLDGHSKDHFYKRHIQRSKDSTGERFLVFFAPEWSRIDEPDFGRNEAKRLEEAVAMGAGGVKVYKSLGLSVKDKTGRFVAVDDPRLDPIWGKCGELGIPVLMHVSDPKAFLRRWMNITSGTTSWGSIPTGRSMAMVFLQKKRCWSNATGCWRSIPTRSSSVRIWPTCRKTSGRCPYGSTNIPISM
ncbi:amidohydrolase family protein [Chitinophaga pollutisoli]|uniref:Amidohydrolase family protein n=1 Tax=Chitinophaga pollutisoli TaxID=3133966 RepID=A0ABZ2YQ67_9BACT